MFKAIISAALVFAFGSVAFANEHETAPAPTHEEGAPAASAKKAEKPAADKKAHGGHEKPHGH